MYNYKYNQANNCIELSKNNEYWFSIPVSVSINEKVYSPSLSSDKNNELIFSSGTEKLTFKFLDDSIEVDFRIKYDAETPIYEAFYFKSTAGGMKISHFNRAFCPQPRRNDGFNMDFYKNLPDCSMNGYYTPSILNFSIGNELGWVSFGLLDIPDSTYYKLCDDFSILVESCGGNKVIKTGEEYVLPQMLITFPEDEWQGITLFRQKLLDYDKFTPKKPPLSEVPSWWRDPLICTYGDELSSLNLTDVEMIDPSFNADWVRMLVDVAEKKWGIKHMNIVLDAFWQIQFALDPKVDEARFGNMRDFVEEMHARGHHVLAWITPMFDSVANGFEPRSKRLNVLSQRALSPLGVDGCFSIDHTADNAAQYYREVAQVLFGSGEGEYNLDGVKMDYMALHKNPALYTPYAHPEKGLGMKELKIFFENFYNAAKSVKPDAIVNCSTTEPRFEHLIDQNRLHDTHSGSVEKEMRARVSSLSCPDLLIDSDGALMLSTWAKRHYIGAAIYSIPSNYYTLTYADRPMEDSDLPGLGTLLQMATLKPDGNPIMESFGNWKLVDRNGNINGLSIDGHTVVYYPWEKSEKGYIFTWQDEIVVLPLNGRKFGKLSPDAKKYQIDYARDHVIIRLKPGVLYTFESVDEGNGIDNIFRIKAASVDEEVDYRN